MSKARTMLRKASDLRASSGSMRILITLFLLVAAMGKVSGQKPSGPPRNIVQIGMPIRLLDNGNQESYYLIALSPNVAYERRLSPVLCPMIQVGWVGPYTLDVEKGETKELIQTNGTSILIGNKFYLPRGNASGAYLSPQLVFNGTKLYEEGSAPGGYILIRDFGVSGDAGMEVIREGGFAIDVYGGAGVFKRHYFDDTLIESPTTIDHWEMGILPRVGLRLGYAF